MFAISDCGKDFWPKSMILLELALDFKSRVSTSFTIRAAAGIIAQERVSGLRTHQ